MKLADNYIIYEAEGEKILVRADTTLEGFHGLVRLNETAERVIQIVSESTTFDDLLKTLASEYKGISEDDLRDDVLNVLTTLRNIAALATSADEAYLFEKPAEDA